MIKLKYLNQLVETGEITPARAKRLRKKISEINRQEVKAEEIAAGRPGVTAGAPSKEYDKIAFLASTLDSINTTDDEEYAARLNKYYIEPEDPNLVNMAKEVLAVTKMEDIPGAVEAWEKTKNVRKIDPNMSVFQAPVNMSQGQLIQQMKLTGQSIEQVIAEQQRQSYKEKMGQYAEGEQALNEFREKYDPEGTISPETVSIRNPYEKELQSTTFGRSFINSFVGMGQIEVIPEPELSPIEKHIRSVDSDYLAARIGGSLTGGIANMLLLNAAWGASGAANVIEGTIFNQFRSMGNTARVLARSAGTGSFFFTRSTLEKSIKALSGGDFTSKDLLDMGVSTLTGLGLGAASTIDVRGIKEATDVAIGYLKGLYDSIDENGNVDQLKAAESAAMYGLFAILAMPGREKALKQQAYNETIRTATEIYMQKEFIKTGVRPSMEEAIRRAKQFVDFGIKEAGGINNIQTGKFYDAIGKMSRKLDTYINSLTPKSIVPVSQTPKETQAGIVPGKDIIPAETMKVEPIPTVPQAKYRPAPGNRRTIMKFSEEGAPVEKEIEGINNTRELGKHIQKIVDAGKKEDTLMAVMDMSGLGELNNKYGRETADNAIEMFMNIADKTINKHDVFLASPSGDELVLVFPENMTHDKATEVVKEFMTAVQNAGFDLEGEKVGLNAKAYIFKGIRNYKTAEKNLKYDPRGNKLPPGTISVSKALTLEPESRILSVGGGKNNEAIIRRTQGGRTEGSRLDEGQMAQGRVRGDYPSIGQGEHKTAGYELREIQGKGSDYQGTDISGQGVKTKGTTLLTAKQLISDIPASVSDSTLDLSKRTSKQLRKDSEFIVQDKTLKQLRKEQDLIDKQIDITMKQLKSTSPSEKTRLERGLSNLRIMRQIRDTAVDIKEFQEQQNKTPVNGPDNSASTKAADILKKSGLKGDDHKYAEQSLKAIKDIEQKLFDDKYNVSVEIVGAAEAMVFDPVKNRETLLNNGFTEKELDDESLEFVQNAKIEFGSHAKEGYSASIKICFDPDGGLICDSQEVWHEYSHWISRQALGELPEKEEEDNARLLARFYSGKKISSNAKQKAEAIINKAKSVRVQEGEKRLSIGARKKKADRVPFYSKLEQVISQKYSKGGPEQTISMLKSNGVKDEEIEWSGILEYLTMNPKASMEELSSFLEGNNVRIERKTSIATTMPEVRNIRESESKHGVYVVAFDDGIDVEVDFSDRLQAVDNDTIINQAIESYRDFFSEQIQEKYAKYTLPGGWNYREILILLKNIDPDADYAAQVAFDRINNRIKSIDSSSRKKELSDFLKIWNTTHQSQDIAFDEFYRAYNNIVLEKKDIKYKSPHYNEPNILTHLRLKDRVIGDKKCLFIEEIQSDWHQEGKKIGYNIFEKKSKEILRKLKKTGVILQYPELEWGFVNKEGLFITKNKTEAEYSPNAFIEGTEEQIKLINEFIKINEKNFSRTQPDAPFKNNAWVDLALKQAIDIAVTEGYDAIAWTTGEQQAERYDLSRQVDSIDIQTINNIDSGGTTILQVTARKDGGILIKQSVFKDNLADLVGKELADQYFASDRKGIKTYEGEDLRVGGEGMKSFYDRLLPNIARKLIRKYGVKLNQFNIKGIGLQFGFDLTPDMKKKIFNEGQSLFSIGIRRKGTGPKEVDLYQVGLTVGKSLATRNMYKKIHSQRMELEDKKRMLRTFAKAWLHGIWKERALKNIERIRSTRSTNRMIKLIDAYIERSDRRDAWKDLVKVFDNKGIRAKYNHLPVKYREKLEAIPDFRYVMNLEKVKQTGVDEMSTDQMRKLADSVREIMYEHENENKIIRVGKEYDLQEALRRAYKNVKRKPRAIRSRNIDISDKPITIGFVRRFMELEQVEPKLVAERLDDSEDDIIKELIPDAIAEGTSKQYNYQRRAGEFINNGLEGIDRKKIAKMSEFFTKNPTVHVIPLGPNREARITSGLRIALFLTAQNPDAYRHMMDIKGGFRLQVRTKTGADISDQVFQLVDEELETIIRSMTPEEHQIAEVFYQYFNVFTRQNLNPISLLLYGYEKFTEPDYYPISTYDLDRHNEQLISEGKQLQATLKNMGWTKDRIKEARNPLIIKDAFYVMAKAIQENSAFFGLALPIEGAKKVIRDPFLGQAIKEHHGIDYLRYMEKYIMDAEGGAYDTDFLEKSAQTILNKFSVSVLGLKPFVVMNQLVSLIGASCEEGYNLPKLMAAKATPVKEMIEWSDMLWARFKKGLVDREVGNVAMAGEMKRLFLNKSTLDTKFMAGITGADAIALGKIWTVAKQNMKKKHGESGLLMQQTTREAERVIRLSQPMWDISDRPPLLRNRRLFTRTATMFHSARSQVYNQTLRSADRYNRSGKTFKDKWILTKNLVKLGLLVPVVLLAIKKLRNYVYGRKVKLTIGSVLADIGEINTSNIMIFGNIITSIKSKIERGSYAGFDVESPLYDMVNECGTLVAEMVNLGKTKKKYGRTWNRKIRRLLDKIADITSKTKGIPYSGVKGLIKGIIKHTEDKVGK